MAEVTEEEVKIGVPGQRIIEQVAEVTTKTLALELSKLGLVGVRVDIDARFANGRGCKASGEAVMAGVPPGPDWNAMPVLTDKTKRKRKTGPTPNQGLI